MDVLYKMAKDMGKKDALDLRKRAPKMDGTALINEEEKIPDFNPKKDYSKLPVGTPVKDEGQVYKLLQPYNAANYDGTPATLTALWGLMHTKNPARAKPFVPAHGTSGMYMKDECCTENGKVYRCKVDSNVYSPTEYALNWTEVQL